MLLFILHLNNYECEYIIFIFNKMGNYIKKFITLSRKKELTNKDLEEINTCLIYIYEYFIPESDNIYDIIEAGERIINKAGNRILNGRFKVDRLIRGYINDIIKDYY